MRDSGTSSSDRGREEGELLGGGDGGRAGDGVEEEDEEEGEDGSGGGGDGGGEFGRGSVRATSRRARASLLLAGEEVLVATVGHGRFDRVPELELEPLPSAEAGAVGGCGGASGRDDVVSAAASVDGSVVAAAISADVLAGSGLWTSPGSELELLLSLSESPSLLSSLSSPPSFRARIKSSSEGRALSVGRMPSIQCSA